MSWTDKARISAAAQAIREIRDNTTIGLGSGNTVLRALELAAERVKKENLKITFIPTSYQTEIAAKKLGLKTSDLQEDSSERSRGQGRTRHNRQREPHRGCIFQKPTPTRDSSRETQEDPGSGGNRTVSRNVRRSLRGKKRRPSRHSP